VDPSGTLAKVYKPRIIIMFVEYINLMRIVEQPEFSFDYIFPVTLLLLFVATIVFIGYKIKEGLGAIIAISICGFFFLYMHDLLKILF
jgi:hypothetical protein